MKTSLLAAVIGGLLTCHATMLASPVVTVDRNGMIEKNRSISFERQADDIFTLTIKFKLHFPEAHFGAPTPLFKISTGTDTVTVAPGMEAFGSFEPSAFVDVTLNGKLHAKFTEKDDMIKEGQEATMRLVSNQATGVRLFVNGHPADFPAWQPNDTCLTVTIAACRDFLYNLIEFDVKETLAEVPCLTLEEIVARLPESTKAPAGLYTWLDRENDPQRARPGGFYKLAVIPDNDNGYIIVYLDGATVNRDGWKTGMLKGKLKKTVFLDHYDLIWYDSNREPVSSETFCTFTDGSIMQLDFPLYSTRLRFSRLNGSASTLIPFR